MARLGDLQAPRFSGGVVDIISDVTQMEKFPTHVWTAIRATQPWLRHRNLGWIILLKNGSNPMLRFLFSAVNQVVGIRYHIVETPEEAFTLLQQLDKTLHEPALDTKATQQAAPKN